MWLTTDNIGNGVLIGLILLVIGGFFRGIWFIIMSIWGKKKESDDKPHINIDIRKTRSTIQFSIATSKKKHETRTLTQEMHVFVIGGIRTIYVNKLHVEIKYLWRWRTLSNGPLIRDTDYILNPQFEPFELKSRQAKDFLVSAIAFHGKKSFRVSMECSDGAIYRSKPVKYRNVQKDTRGIIIENPYLKELGL
jgi:hypothetical protein